MRALPLRLLVLAALLSGSLAFAQDNGGTAEPNAGNAGNAGNATSSTGGAAALSKDAAGDEEDPANAVPPSKYLETATESLAAMRQDLSRGLDQLRLAREKKDAVMLTYVNEQVTAMKGILRVCEDAMVSLQEALAANDTERARYEFRKIEVSKRKMDDLLQAALNAAGAEATESNTSVTMEVDPSLSIADPYYGNPSFFYDPSTGLESAGTGALPGDNPEEPRPPCASGTGAC